jgi:DNA-binding transcriptional regulator YiaG
MAKTKQQALRFSVPPYCVGSLDGNMRLPDFSGEVWQCVERDLAINATQARSLLLQLRSKLRWSRPKLAAFLGVSPHVVRRWETGQRNPSGAARRLIWLLHLLITAPQKLTSGLDLIVWGRGQELTRFWDLVSGGGDLPAG